MNEVKVRWFDGYTETMEADIVILSDCISAACPDGVIKIIPSKSVRWIEVGKESE